MFNARASAEEEQVNHSLSRRAWLGVAGASAAAALVGCGSPQSETTTMTVTVPASPEFTTETPRPAITDADVALKELQDGNQRFVAGQMEHPGQDPQRRLALAQYQQPFAVILTCSDSRLPPEVVFDQGLGDLFVVRVAGNIVDAALLGSIEYAVEHLGTRLIMALGHQSCGAVAATLESIQHHTKPHGNIAALVDAITPAVAVAEQRPGDLLDNTIRANAEQSRDAIAKSSEIKGPVSSGAVKVVSAYYSLDAGSATVL
jgi:carbonic anhydrase